MGFWSPLRDVWPETKEQRCWFHKLGNVIDKLPKKLQPKGKRILHEVLYADNKKAAEEAVEAFSKNFSPKHERAVKCLQKDREAMLTFFDFPAAHWKHLRTTNAIESSFATIRLRQRVTKGAGSRTKGLTMVFNLLAMAQGGWRKINGYEQLPLVKRRSKVRRRKTGKKPTKRAPPNYTL